MKRWWPPNNALCGGRERFPARRGTAAASGFDVIMIAERSAGASDKDVLGIAGDDGRILITEDRDFGELVVRQQFKLAGVILLELDRLSNAAEADLVTAVIATHLDRLANSLVVIEPARVRFRRL